MEQGKEQKMGDVPELGSLQLVSFTEQWIEGFAQTQPVGRQAADGERNHQLNIIKLWGSVPNRLVAAVVAAVVPAVVAAVVAVANSPRLSYQIVMTVSARLCFPTSTTIFEAVVVRIEMGSCRMFRTLGILLEFY